MSDKTNLSLKDLKNKKTLKERGKLTDAELDKVTGGYWEYQGYAAGYWIECPFCGRFQESDFATWADTAQQVDQFRCKCNGAFAVDAAGNMYY
ncbi:MAG: hypothetical protein K6G83_08545 [Lachnospiraceae bacterium]|nr:hypothetical protein [Lachnospiraceae bacterium]